MNLLLAKTTRQAKACLEAFRLPEDEWRPLAYSAALIGCRFDRIVVVEPYFHSKVEAQQYKELLSTLACHLNDPSVGIKLIIA